MLGFARAEHNIIRLYYNVFNAGVGSAREWAVIYHAGPVDVNCLVDATCFRILGSTTHRFIFLLL